MTLRSQLLTGLKQLKIENADGLVDPLLQFLELLQQWNRIHNLTAVRDPVEMVSHHLLDSLAVLPFLAGPRVLDIGSGAGLPGIPLALARPGLEFVLLDSNAKKAAFLQQAVTTLGLKNVTIVRIRAEDFQAGKKFDTLIARAVTGIPKLLAQAGHLMAADGQLLAMKGKVPEAELAALPAAYEVLGKVPLQVPGLDAERCVISIVPGERE